MTESQHEIVRKHFNEYAGTWHDRLEQHPYAARFRVVTRMVDRLAPSTVVDIGCGTGDYCTLFDAEDVDYLGLDLSEGMVEQCRQLYPNHTFEVGNADQIEVPDAHADLVLNVAVLEYYADPLPQMREMVRITKPGGTLIVVVPNSDYLSDTVHRPIQGLASWVGAKLRRRRPAESGGSYLKDERVFHNRFSVKLMSQMGHECGVELQEHAFVSVRLLPLLFGWMNRLNRCLSNQIGDRLLLRWLARRSATILVTRFTKA